VNPFDRELNQRLATLREQGLHRELRRIDSAQSVHIKSENRTFLNFSSNNYLGLANHPALKKAAVEAIDAFGAGTGASRLICGSLAPHHKLEDALAEFKGTEAALSFSTGYATAIGTICALVDKQDVIVIDKLVHACVVDAARLSGAKLRVFDHNDLNHLADILRWADKRTRDSEKSSRTLIVTESVFSMDGDQAPLREIVELKEKHGAWLMVDEAHATGVFGKHRRGLAEAMGVGDHIEIQMGTLGKGLGASGGYICGSRALVDYLINRARSFIFSTAPAPSAAAAAEAGIRLVQSADGEKLCRELWENIQLATAGLRDLWSSFAQHGSLKNFSGPAGDKPASAILPLIIGDENEAVRTAAALRERGIFVPAIRYPTVARGSARLRVTLSASHSAEDISLLASALKEIIDRKS
jgi:8-amino-7-oxononanoate synthase